MNELKELQENIESLFKEIPLSEKSAAIFLATDSEGSVVAIKGTDAKMVELFFNILLQRPDLMNILSEAIVHASDHISPKN